MTTLLSDPQAWVSFLTLALLEIVLGIDNIIFLLVLVERLPLAQRRQGRILGLAFAMLTRIGLLLSVTWIASMRQPLATVAGLAITGRGLILFCGGVFLVFKSVAEIRALRRGRTGAPRRVATHRLWVVILQIGLIDIAFSLDTVFTAVGLARQVEVMVAAIVVSVLVMMLIASALGAFIDRHPRVKMLALVFLALVGGALIAASLDREIPPGYLYGAMAVSAIVEWLIVRLRRRRPPNH
jgi:predicted tellurium resistance membrane protein TerC